MRCAWHDLWLAAGLWPPSLYRTPHRHSTLMPAALAERPAAPTLLLRTPQHQTRGCRITAARTLRRSSHASTSSPCAMEHPRHLGASHRLLLGHAHPTYHQPAPFIRGAYKRRTPLLRAADHITDAHRRPMLQCPTPPLRMPPGPAVSMPPPGHRRVSPQPSERLLLFLRATTSPTRTRKQRRAAQAAANNKAAGCAH